MNIRLATAQDIKQIVSLQNSCHISNLRDCDKSDGFLNTVLGTKLLSQLIEESSVFVAELNGDIVAMAVCGSWQFWRCSESLSTVASNLSDTNINGVAINTENSYFWGPVCISKLYRGKGVFEKIFEFSCTVKSGSYPYVYTYVHKDNLRSFSAHTEKADFYYTKDFYLNDEIFQEMVRETRFV